MQIPDLERKHDDRRATAPVRSPQLSKYRAMTDGMLADEHRGQSFAKRRADDELAAIEAELDRRALSTATGQRAHVMKSATVGLVDLRRLRDERPDIVAAYAKPGSKTIWTSRTLTAEARA